MAKNKETKSVVKNEDEKTESKKFTKNPKTNSLVQFEPYPNQPTHAPSAKNVSFHTVA